MEDADSIAIVATENGELIPYSGASLEAEDKREAVKAIWNAASWVVAFFGVRMRYPAMAASQIARRWRA